MRFTLWRVLPDCGCVCAQADSARVHTVEALERWCPDSPVLEQILASSTPVRRCSAHTRHYPHVHSPALVQAPRRALKKNSPLRPSCTDSLLSHHLHRRRITSRSQVAAETLLSCALDPVSGGGNSLPLLRSRLLRLCRCPAAGASCFCNLLHTCWRYRTTADVPRNWKD
jgi:hypothetical protein